MEQIKPTNKPAFPQEKSNPQKQDADKVDPKKPAQADGKEKEHKK